MRQWTVDAFADRPFRGNPACVVEPVDEWPDAAWMQALAQENNQAETAYLRRTADPARFGLRWFTPGVEVDLCGHATLASAHVLFAELGLRAETVAFETRSGRLAVAREGDLYRMDFPADPPKRLGTAAGLAAALGAEPREVWAARYLIAILVDETAVRGLTPDLAAIRALTGMGEADPGEVVIAALADPGSPYDVVSRFFAPGYGIPEDPTTGSSHCILAPLFAGKLGRNRNRFFQAYPGRGGALDCEASGERVLIRGRATTVIAADLRIGPAA